MGARLEIREGETLLERLLAEGADIGHDCGGKRACTTCRVSVLEGELPEASEDELDLLDRAGAGASDRLSCQVRGPADVTIELRAATAPIGPDGGAVRITPEAAIHLLAQLQSGAVAVRLKVEPSGCSGLRHRMEPALEIGADDAVFRCGALAVLVHARDLPFVAGTTIHLEKAGLASKLRFSNPNATGGCGCGESFSTA
jgi:iron-sulfur cluster assembly protein